MCGAKPLLYWAVLEHHRWWVSDDQVQLNRVRARGAHDERSVRHIGKAYAVGRGIHKLDKKIDHGAPWIAAELMNAKWPKDPDLVARWRCCYELADRASKTKIANTAVDGPITRGVLISAMTKLFWFLYPDNWTMFDRLAANGLGIPDWQTTKRSKAFYTKLEATDFVDVCAEGNRVIRSNQLSCESQVRPLYMERVVDKFLSFRGMPHREVVDRAELLAAYLDVFPLSYRNQITGLAEQIMEEFRARSVFSLPSLAELQAEKKNSKNARNAA